MATRRVIVVGPGVSSAYVRELLTKHPEYVVVYASTEEAAAGLQGTLVTGDTLHIPDSVMEKLDAVVHYTVEGQKPMCPPKIAPYGKKAKRQKGYW